MKNINKILKRSAAILLIMAVMSLNSIGQTYNENYHDGALYFKFKDNVEVNIPVNPDRTVNLDDAAILGDLREKYSISALTRPFDLNDDDKLLRSFRLEFTQFNEIEAIMEELSEHPDLEYVEKVPIQRLDYVPDDELYNLVLGSSNWNWQHDVVLSELAWDITQGDPDINVAIIDGAVWIDHEDLADDVYDSHDVTSPPGGTNNSNPPASGDPEDWSHGTHCAGLAVGDTDNGIGIAGLGFDCSLIGVKCTPDNGNPGFVYNGYGGMQWAANNGAHVISSSWGGSGYSQTEQNLINTINGMGVVVLGSRGNEASAQLRYPSCYNHVIGVAATDEDDVKAGFSSYGTGTDVSAPGGTGISGPNGLLSTVNYETSRGFYDSYFGTSMSTPFTAGLCGLILSLNPDLSPEEVEDILESTCDNIDTIPGNANWAGQLGAGRINAFQAVSNTPYEPVADFTTAVPYITPGTSIEFTDLSEGVPNEWSWEFTGGDPTVSNDQDPVVTYEDEGSFTVSLAVTNDWGLDILTVEEYITVTATPVPWVLFAAGEEEPCVATDEVSFTDESLYDPTSWLWEFDPNTVTFVNGTDETSQNPEVLFNAPGEYSVTLTATNANGSGFKTEESMIIAEGIELNFEETFEEGEPGDFTISSMEKASIGIDSRAAAPDSDYGLHFEGAPVTGGWTGGPYDTTPEEAWEDNTEYHAFAENCHVDATGVEGVTLTLDLRQTFSIGSTYSWFRVLINGEQVPDWNGVENFNPETNEDPWETINFDLSNWGNSGFTITLQSACYLADGFGGLEGDNVFVDNIMISNTTSIVEGKGSDAGVLTYPNPASNVLNYSVSGLDKGFTVSLMSATGQMVYNDQVENNIGNGQVDVSNLTPGIYILVISDDKDTVRKKIVVE